MAETTDVRDFGAILAERDNIKDELEKTRERLREADAEARKVPSLSAEVERLQGELASKKDAHEQTSEELAQAQRRAAELESIQRDQDELEGELDEAVQDAVHFNGQTKAVQEKLQAAKNHIDHLHKAIKERDDEIAELVKHKEQTHALVGALKQAERLTS